MLPHEISPNEIPFNTNEDGGELVSLPVLKSNQQLSPHDIISTNYYLEIVVYRIYFALSKEYPMIINLPNSISVENLPFLPLTQALTNLFSFQRAIIKKDFTVSQIFVKGLLPSTLEAIKRLDNSNKIDRLVKKLFYMNKPYDSNIKPIRAYVFDNRDNFLQNNYELSKIQKYLIWECMKNNGVYGLPIGTLSYDDIGQNDFQQIIRPFEKTYIAGSGDPWVASHLIVHNIDREFLKICSGDDCSNINPPS